MWLPAPVVCEVSQAWWKMLVRLSVSVQFPHFSFDLRPDPPDRTAQKHCTITSSNRTAWGRRKKKSRVLGRLHQHSRRIDEEDLFTSWANCEFDQTASTGDWTFPDWTVVQRTSFLDVALFRKNGDTPKKSEEIKTSQRRASHGQWFWQFCWGLHHQARNQVTNSQTDGPVERQRTNCSSRYVRSLSGPLCWSLRSFFFFLRDIPRSHVKLFVMLKIMQTRGTFLTSEKLLNIDCHFLFLLLLLFFNLVSRRQHSTNSSLEQQS